MTTVPELHATRLVISRLDLSVREALRSAGIDLFRVPAATDRAVEVRLELDAASPADALSKIRAALSRVSRSVRVVEVVFAPAPLPGHRLGDGPLE